MEHEKKTRGKKGEKKPNPKFFKRKTPINPFVGKFGAGGPKKGKNCFPQRNKVPRVLNHRGAGGPKRIREAEVWIFPSFCPKPKQIVHGGFGPPEPPKNRSGGENPTGVTAPPKTPGEKGSAGPSWGKASCKTGLKTRMSKNFFFLEFFPDPPFFSRERKQAFPFPKPLLSGGVF